MVDSELVVDLRATELNSLGDFWDAVRIPCGLPDWFGRNLDAWWDTIDTRQISETIDSSDVLVIRARARGLFAPGNPQGAALVQVMAQSAHARLELDAA